MDVVVGAHRLQTWKRLTHRGIWGANPERRRRLERRNCELAADRSIMLESVAIGKLQSGQSADMHQPVGLISPATSKCGATGRIVRAEQTAGRPAGRVSRMRKGAPRSRSAPDALPGMPRKKQSIAGRAPGGCGSQANLARRCSLGHVAEHGGFDIAGMHDGCLASF